MKSLTRNFALEPGSDTQGNDPRSRRQAPGRHAVYGHGGMRLASNFGGVHVFGLTPPRPRTVGRLLQMRSMESLGAMVLPDKSRTLLFQHEGSGWPASRMSPGRQRNHWRSGSSPGASSTAASSTPTAARGAGFVLHPKILDKPRGDADLPLVELQDPDRPRRPVPSGGDHPGPPLPPDVPGHTRAQDRSRTDCHTDEARRDPRPRRRFRHHSRRS